MEALQDRHQRMIQVIQAATAEIATRIANSTKIKREDEPPGHFMQAGELEGGE